MVVKANKEILVVRFSQYKKVDFIEEHLKLIRKIGNVWMLKIGRKIPEKSLKNVLSENGMILLKAPKKVGGKYYLAMVEEYHNGLPKDSFVYPDYYKEIIEDCFGFSLEGTWIKVNCIKEMPKDLLNNFQMSKNGKPLENVINSTRTSVLYAVCNKDFEIK